MLTHKSEPTSAYRLLWFPHCTASEVQVLHQGLFLWSGPPVSQSLPGSLFSKHELWTDLASPFFFSPPGKIKLIYSYFCELPWELPQALETGSLFLFSSQLVWEPGREAEATLTCSCLTDSILSWVLSCGLLSRKQTDKGRFRAGRAEWRMPTWFS